MLPLTYFLPVKAGGANTNGVEVAEVEKPTEVEAETIKVVGSRALECTSVEGTRALLVICSESTIELKIF